MALCCPNYDGGLAFLKNWMLFIHIWKRKRKKPTPTASAAASGVMAV